ncbi:sulfurtransferase complex subunit TusD [Corallincola platygyrae]|uniref:Sulfurtransferase complex subunit TusD n=1 Tax=Corallincola platygyrae TaxID=1193278 RepID=A0ABW4XHZ7_9GAMM
MATFTISISASPVSHQAHKTAYQFALAAITQGHSVKQVFFFQEGVTTGSKLLSPAGNESNWAERWAGFSAEHSVPLILCVASSLRRGILNQEEADDVSGSANLHSGFHIGGLGELVTHSLKSDRTIHFK